MSQQIQAQDLIDLGYPKNHILGIALQMNKKRHGFTRAKMIQYYTDVLLSPDAFVEDVVFRPLALALLKKEIRV